MNSRFVGSAILLICLAGSAQAGVIEICKYSDPTDSLSGFYNFTIAGQTDPATGQLAIFTTLMDYCSGTPIVLPDGLDVITEVPVPGSVLENVSTLPYAFSLQSFDPQTATATVLAVGGDLLDSSTWVEVDFTNTPAPEPGTGWLVGAGLALWALRRNLSKRLAPAHPPAALPHP
jgi:hypothetical protein